MRQMEMGNRRACFCRVHKTDPAAKEGLYDQAAQFHASYRGQFAFEQ